MTDRSRKVAVVTGIPSDIGNAVALQLATDGFTVVVNHTGDVAPAEALLAQIKAVGGYGGALQADISDPDAVRHMFDRVENDFGGIDVLVNNAGTMTLANTTESDDALFERHIAVYLNGTFNTLREASKRMRDGGRIVNLSSRVIALLQPTYGVYATTEATMETMTRILAQELRGRNITVNTVVLSPAATDPFLHVKPRESIDQPPKLSRLERLRRPDDVADAVAFLVGSDGGYINGQTLRANDGVI